MIRFLKLLLSTLLVAGCSTGSRLQLVQSVPVETTGLAQPDLPQAQSVWLEMIDGATRSIDLCQFYATAKPGGALEPVIEALRQASGRGVHIRMLVSDRLLEPSKETLERLKEFVEVKVLDLSKVSGGIIHTKYWIVDGQEAFVGSQNFDWRALTHIHELGIRTQDPAVVRGLSAIFEADWAASWTEATLVGPSPDDRSVELVASPEKLNPRGVRDALTALLELIGSARGSLKIQLLSYYLGEPGKEWRVIDDALREAAARGVDVRLLVSDWLKKKANVEQLLDLDRVKGVAVKVASIPQHSSGKIPFARVIHSKYMVVDGQTLWLGTSNWSESYFTRSRNVELIVRRPARVAATVAQVHDRLWGSRYVWPIAASAGR